MMNDKINKFLHRKESVILTTIEIIDELGMQGLSTREIAKRQGISEGTLFRHFASKREIVLAVLDYFSKFDSAIFQSVQCKELQVKDAVNYMIDSYVIYYENYPAITALPPIYGFLLADPDFAEATQSILDQRKNCLLWIFDRGKQLGEVDPDLDGALLADIIMGAFSRICLEWRVNKRDFSLKEKVRAAIQMITDALII